MVCLHSYIISTPPFLDVYRVRKIVSNKSYPGKKGYIPGVFSKFGIILSLCKIDITQCPFNIFVRFKFKINCTGTGRDVRELNKSPGFGSVHIHNALGRPYPILLRQGFSCFGILSLPVLSFSNISMPLYAAEVNSPLSAIGRFPVFIEFGQDFKWKSDFNTPTTVFVRRVV